jgi:gentisate 1,2-dioxygenase
MDQLNHPIRLGRQPSVEAPGATTASSTTDSSTTAAQTIAAPIVPAINQHASHDWHAETRIFNYAEAANPVRHGLTEPIPLRSWSSRLYSDGPSAIIPLDLSAELGCTAPATSPALAAHFLRLVAGEPLLLAAEATSSLFYVLSGSGRLSRAEGVEQAPLSLAWNSGDVFVLPAGEPLRLETTTAAVLYWVHDGPLLSYLGVVPKQPRFSASHYPAPELDAALARLLADPAAMRGNRLSILLGHAAFPSSRTVTHTLWAMLGVVPGGAVQPPHRHQSVALDLIIDCPPGCHTLVGRELAEDGSIDRAQKVEWEPGGAFITPPGLWHAHVNPTDQPARLLPIQDAGLHTHLRSLDIRFAGGLQSA